MGAGRRGTSWAAMIGIWSSVGAWIEIPGWSCISGCIQLDHVVVPARMSFVRRLVQPASFEADILSRPSRVLNQAKRGNNRDELKGFAVRLPAPL